jgi:hypothetical protein
MNFILLLLFILLLILIFMNYNKIINKKNKSNNKIKKVKWGLNNSISIPHYNHPDGDFFNEYTKYTDKEMTNQGVLNSNITKYLENMKNSYSSIIYDTNPQKASIPINPENLNEQENFENISAHNIINENDPNTRVLEYRENSKIYDSMTVGNVYDTLVDNYRVQWSKFNNLDGYGNNNYYSLDIKPKEIGYTDFPTY